MGKEFLTLKGSVPRAFEPEELPMKIVPVVGIRPPFIKVVLVNRQRSALGVPEALAHAGQHYDANISGVSFEQLAKPEPNYRK